MKQRNILVVEDTELDKYIIEFNLKMLGITNTIIFKTTATDTLVYLSEIDPENYPVLIFLDLNLPEMNGFEFLEIFNGFQQNQKEKTKIVVLSSSKNQDEIDKAEQFSSVLKFVSKPIDQKKLEIVFELLNQNKIIDLK